MFIVLITLLVFYLFHFLGVNFVLFGFLVVYHAYHISSISEIEYNLFNLYVHNYFATYF